MNAANTVQITTQNLTKTLEAPGIVVLDFWAPWCGPCRAFAPIFEAAAGRHRDATFGKVNTQEQPELASAFGVQAIPTVMVFRDSVLLFEQPGMLPPAALDKLLDQVRTLDMDAVRKKSAEHDPQAN
ncbi:MAG: thioredoxin fold domain-containing protein [Myxococcales bacterium]|nr:thioredoxin fold domain-containing protein [Myxococcales bacterium]